MKKNSLSTLIEGALMVGIATTLSFVKIFQAPYGGSVTLGSMVPILLYSMRNGASKGIVAGASYGLLQLIIEPYIVHPVQVILDYPLAFGLLGLAGLFNKKVWTGITVGILGRFFSHFLSGVIFFGSYAPEGMNAFVYSALYNGAYLLPELAISLLAVRFVFYRFIRKDEEQNYLS
ncbi:thiamine transporter [Caldanaerovirga acetigignens]|uniref:Thiamine transporter n=1 Tax=Caldanaerovirga acetigignens TaxID=447595 RepID=A0A1M7K0F3_9FIRM|nr:energy-coupled thiamine transporter ThiT [Caldanaerovirga acetigignens]SHM58746.1 thiamine transporter [Caldanaerovirga acetigignens]